MLESGMVSPRGVPEWYIGTMGFSYVDWNGVFYPDVLPANHRLGYYSRIFNAVEIDSTFYGTPRPETVRGWAAATPAEFRFALKVPRQLTHEAGLVGVMDELHRFIDTVTHLQEKLGVILFQFPPSFRQDRLSALQACLAGLPGGIRYAVEIRHQSWYTPEIKGPEDSPGEPALAQRLREVGVCWAATEYPDLPRRIYPTTDFLYVRWIGQHGSYQLHNQERMDRTAQLYQWLQIMEGARSEIEGRRVIFGFFNNDYAGFAAGTANRFKELSGLPVNPFLPPQQGKLF
jgi:uncharacterized protein YecE (DUF72 family)